MMSKEGGRKETGEGEQKLAGWEGWALWERESRARPCAACHSSRQLGGTGTLISGVVIISYALLI